MAGEEARRQLHRMLRAILNKFWLQHPTRHQLYGHLLPITKTIQVRRTRHAGHCWRSRNKLISDVLLWTPSYDRGKAGRPARTYIQQLSEDMGCSSEYLPETMNDREKWRERVRDICASGSRWWWWKLFLFSIIKNGNFLPLWFEMFLKQRFNFLIKKIFAFTFWVLHVTRRWVCEA